MPTPIVTPPGGATSSTWQIGTYNAVNDSWTLSLDLNDRATWFVKTYDIPQPEKVVSRSGNPRTQGERITNTRYKNRYITLTLLLRSTTTLAAIDTAIHSLEAALSNTPFMLRFAEAQAAQYSYAIVKSWVHSIPQDPLQRLAKVKTGITLVLECEPGLLGDKLYLDNLVVNPGFEAPSGPGVVAFNDNFANVNAYSVAAGSVPTVAGAVMTIPAGTRLQFGSPAWGAINLWQMRVQTPAAGGWDFQPGLHINGSSSIFANVFGTGFELHQNSSGTDHLLGSVGATLNTSTWYWLTFVQFPTVPGTAAYVQFSVNADSAGTIGALITTIGPVATFDATSALTGKMQINAVTGAFNVSANIVQLFGPGGWTTVQNGGTGLVSFAWEQATANTYPNGPVTSYGAARIDFAPAGTISAYWTGFNSGAPAGTNAMPASPSQVFGVSAQAKTNGVGVGFQAILYLSEYNSVGSFLRQTQVQALTGVQPWMALSGTVTTGANCAYVSVWLLAFDNSAGASANGTIWFDNVQVWNQTTTGQTTMPYCELRFPQSPAQLLVSGLVGDLPAPATLSFGTYIGGSFTSPFNFLIGRRAYATSGAQMVTALVDTNTPSNPHQAGLVPTLDSTSYGGMSMKWTSGGSGGIYTPTAFSGKPADYQGYNALIVRMQSSETSGTNVGKVTVTGYAGMQNAAWNQATIFYDSYATAAVAGLAAQNVWTLVNAGVFPTPGYARSVATDLTQNYQAVTPSFNDSNTTPTSMLINWLALLPNDGSTVRGQIQYQGNVVASVFNSWNWYYVDASQGNTGLVPITGFSVEAMPLPNITHAVGGYGIPPSSSPNGAVSVIPTGNAYLTLDPQPPKNALSVSGVNQIVAILDNQSIDALYTALSYTPLYLDPR